MSELATAAPIKPAPPPMLVMSNVLVSITATPPTGDGDMPAPPWGPYKATISPFNRRERTAYFAAMKPFLDKDGEIIDQPAGQPTFDDKQAELLAPRIKSWDALLTPDSVAPITSSTVALLPPFAYTAFLRAALGEGGELVAGN